MLFKTIQNSVARYENLCSTHLCRCSVAQRNCRLLCRAFCKAQSGLRSTLKYRVGDKVCQAVIPAVSLLLKQPVKESRMVLNAGVIEAVLPLVACKRHSYPESDTARHQCLYITLPASYLCCEFVTNEQMLVLQVYVHILSSHWSVSALCISDC